MAPGKRRRDRERRPARGPARRSPKRRLLVVCEGRVTEPAYVRGYERSARNATVEVRIHPAHGVPRTVVEAARDAWRGARAAAGRRGDEFLSYDEVWALFDRDQHPRFADACQMARDNRIELAVSNPCFELWLLLHFRDSPGARERHQVQKMLKRHLPGYDKHLDYEDVAQGAAQARERARRLDADATLVGESFRNPTTGVFRLLESISRSREDATEGAGDDLAHVRASNRRRGREPRR